MHATGLTGGSANAKVVEADAVTVVALSLNHQPERLPRSVVSRVAAAGVHTAGARKRVGGEGSGVDGMPLIDILVTANPNPSKQHHAD